MKKNSFIFFFIVLSAMHLSAQDGISFARWPATPVIADGNDEEWVKPLNLYDAESGFLFTAANDKKMLYFCFTVRDGRKISKLMKAGWTVEISSKEKNKKFDASIVFPAAPMINAPGKDQGIAHSERADLRGDIDLYKLNLQSVTTGGFVSLNGTQPLLTADKINIGVGSDSTQEIIFEIAIPFKELYPENNMQLNEELALNVTVNALKKPAGSGNSEDMNSFNGGGGGRRGGGGGRMGGGGGGGRRGGDGSGRSSEEHTDRSQLFSKVSFKQKFRLTDK